MNARPNTDQRPPAGPYAFAARAWRAAGFSPLPLPLGQKFAPPTGYTGAGAPMASAADVEAWSETHGAGNVAIRLPADVIGIDVDVHKGGLATWQALQAKHDLPPTWRSTAREDPQEGIRLYRVPAGTDTSRMRDPGPGVELIRHEHRYAVAAPSRHPEGGQYRVYGPDGAAGPPPHVSELPLAPTSLLEALADPNVTTPAGPVEPGQWAGMTPQEQAQALTWAKAALSGVESDLLASAGWTEGQTDDHGRGWEKLQADAFLRANRLLLAVPELDATTVRDRLFAAAPTSPTWTVADVMAKWASQGAAAARKGPADLSGVGSIFTTASSSAAVTGGTTSAPDRARVELRDAAQQIDFARHAVGHGVLSGLFLRDGDVVSTTAIGEEGYIAPTTVGDHNGSHTVRVETRDRLHSRFDYAHAFFQLKETKNGDVLESSAAIMAVAPRHVIANPEACPNLRPLDSIIHTPMLRADGTVLDTPGYDEATRTLYLPLGEVSEVADRPTAQQVKAARDLLLEMVEGFPFVNADYRANALGFLITPPLRSICPPPYKQTLINAFNPGSGKTLLATLGITIHGGSVRQSFPSTDEELGKEVATMLDTTTGAYCVFDNADRIPKSSTYDSLLTSERFTKRRLGSNSSIEARNDRLWCVTGNHVTYGGDLLRRTIEVVIDPGMPNPETRTNFRHPDLIPWVRTNRGRIVGAILTLARAWVVAGRPVQPATTTDSYATWVQTIRGILAFAGIDGTFDTDATRRQGGSDEDADLGEFLEAIHGHYEDRSWTAATLHGGRLLPHGGVRAEAWPSELLADLDQRASPTSATKALGKWLSRHQGRWGGPYTIRKAGLDHDKRTLWRIEHRKAAEE